MRLPNKIIPKWIYQANTRGPRTETRGPMIGAPGPWSCGSTVAIRRSNPWLTLFWSDVSLWVALWVEILSYYKYKFNQLLNWHIWRCCQTNENSHQIASAAWTYTLNNWRHSARAAVRLSLKLSREYKWRSWLKWLWTEEWTASLACSPLVVLRFLNIAMDQ